LYTARPLVTARTISAAATPNSNTNSQAMRSAAGRLSTMKTNMFRIFLVRHMSPRPMLAAQKWLSSWAAPPV
jgi:hypothetical protein